jgi:calcineurin-like phosphoesterase family protein
MFFKHYSNKLCLDHFPSAEWAEAHHGSWMLHGHTHGSFDYEARGLANYRIFDVGWDESPKHDTGYGYHPDAHGYKPFSLDFLNKQIGSKEKLPHHGYTRPDGYESESR